ncbi:roadblock/LC7 domain-containing protein [uncultured Eudoraea sp.]|uniref:roadblock/LC7 domain-containing protein n=1 Tax=uncultured Eudoraea sp. TaxID=1035614 RepID=UPI002638DCA5|nr:roadblock/LC7 domain-containing protein [uncultured Eudoraea sp.]
MLNQKQLHQLNNILRQNLIAKGVSCTLLIDMAGNIVACLDDGKTRPDIYSLACLAAGNFGAVKAMADIIGEGDFSLLFNKGKNVNVHYKVIASEYLLINIFNKDLSLGFLRLKVNEVVKKMNDALHIPAKEDITNIVYNLSHQPVVI